MPKLNTLTPQETFIEYISNKDYPKIHSEDLCSSLPFHAKKDCITKQGKWTLDEDKMLLYNWQLFLQDYPKAKDQQAIIFYPSHTPYKIEIRKFVKSTRLYERLGNMLGFFIYLIGHGINRFLKNVFWRARIVIGAKEFKTGPLDNREHEEIIKLYQNYGPKWALIGTFVGRKPDTVRDHMLRHLTRLTSGKWKDDEVDRLLGALRNYAVDDENNAPYLHTFMSNKLLPPIKKSSQIDWKLISSHVGTRDIGQCREHWMQSLRPKCEALTSTAGEGRIPLSKTYARRVITSYRREKKVALLRALKQVKHLYEDDREVDWVQVALLADMEGNQTYLSRLYHSMKRRMFKALNIEPDATLTFPKIVKKLRKWRKSIKFEPKSD